MTSTLYALGLTGFVLAASAYVEVTNPRRRVAQLQARQARK